MRDEVHLSISFHLLVIHVACLQDGWVIQNKCFKPEAVREKKQVLQGYYGN